MNQQPYSISIRDLNDAVKQNPSSGTGRKDTPSEKKSSHTAEGGIPPELLTSTQLIYSSPATLAFNSPGAEGFGVKRAGLAVPGSIMLLVAPGCCGRNTRLLSEVKGYEDRFFFLLMDESDIVTGRHLDRIPEAIEEILDYLDEKPSCVMICSTCVDALLGTDWERVCRKAQKRVQIPVRPCYMYALTREGRKPPMVLVRKSIYSMLEPAEKRNSRTVNLLGYFAPLIDGCEFYDILRQMGIRKINEISRCRSFSEYQEMSEANFNIVLDPECRTAADDLEKRLKIPYLEIPRLYQPEKIRNLYRIFGKTLGTEVDDSAFYEETKAAVVDFRNRFGDLTFAVGEMMNANAFELSLALVQMGFHVSEIYTNISEADFPYIRHLAEASPETRVYTNISPTMLFYDIGNKKADVTIGKDAKYYHPDSPNVAWNEDRQPFGYAGVRKLFRQLTEALEKTEVRNVTNQ